MALVWAGPGGWGTRERRPAVARVDRRPVSGHRAECAGGGKHDTCLGGLRDGDLGAGQGERGRRGGWGMWGAPGWLVVSGKAPQLRGLWSISHTQSCDLSHWRPVCRWPETSLGAVDSQAAQPPSPSLRRGCRCRLCGAGWGGRLGAAPGSSKRSLWGFWETPGGLPHGCG